MNTCWPGAPAGADCPAGGAETIELGVIATGALSTGTARPDPFGVPMTAVACVPGGGEAAPVAAPTGWPGELVPTGPDPVVRAAVEGTVLLAWGVGVVELVAEWPGRPAGAVPAGLGGGPFRAAVAPAFVAATPAAGGVPLVGTSGPEVVGAAVASTVATGPDPVGVPAGDGAAASVAAGEFASAAAGAGSSPG